MTMQSSTLRPGLLVSLKTSIEGNCKYAKRTIEGAHIDETGAQVAIWETERTITDAAEFDLAKKTRAKARATIASVCSLTAFGLLCPEDKAAKLEDAVTEARKLCSDFNKDAELTRCFVYVITGRVAQDDVEAVRAINSEVRELVATMQDGLVNLDVKAVREAADKARALGQMLAPDAAERVKEAIEAARAAARKIVKTGETVAQEIDKSTLATLARARTEFLDLDDAAPVAAPHAEARAVDMTPDADIKPATPAAPARNIEL